MLTLREMKASATGVAIRSLGAKGTDTGHNYFTAMSWMSDNRHILLCTDIDKEKKGRYIKADTHGGATEVIVERLDWGRGLVAHDDCFYYYDGPHIYEHHLVGGRVRTVCSLESDAVVYGPLSVTNDGRTMGIYWRSGEQWIIGTVDVGTGHVQEAAAPSFEEPYPIANHAMINPVYRNLVFFAHEGKTEHIPDRIYIADTESGEVRSGFHQKRRLDSGEHVEYVGHEMWAPNGEHLYFVKYPQSPLKPTGVYRVDKWSGDAEFINGDFPYWHVSLSPDGQWAVADTIEDGAMSKIVLINLYDRSSRLLCELPIWRDHPGHPHPSFSQDSRKISFTYADEERHLRVGIIDMEEGNESHE
ncbi:oligogalacturonate lyase family protein [Paenibacillus sp. J5C_2022]|uniref:TolB family protein n=1 Tax=Paenibacillus sp. J5C2022 TaxID=2977129 RepID=UPI0021CFBA65|nr:oligogalacturonate lyase family protein [Paenibacillus sp. J5C2022]MCU6707831.1 oligogalacturonate lyase family protein [Paenibacillus sp. J5C2022]